MPAKKAKAKTAPLTVPELGEDSLERKRVLNVLAQRRYRQRRKEHIRKLEAQVEVTEIHPPPQPSPPPSTVRLQSISPRSEEDEATTNDSQSHCPFAAAVLQPFGNDQALPMDSNIDPQHRTWPEDPLTSMFSYDQGLWDTSVLLPSLPSTPLSTPKQSSSSGSDIWPGTPSVATTSPKGWQAPQSPPFTFDDTTYSFPDEAYLEMTELTFLRGCMSIARRLNIQDIIWSFSATSPFTNPELTMADFNHLPANLRPTLLQMAIPHHPVIDLLPWPLARDRMIKILAQPPEFRPPGAASPMALLNFVYDIEDSAEGVRISGDDPYSGQNWEVGEKVFNSWWWLFDRDIIRRSNHLRACRGAPMLGGSVLEEIA
ncbi:hypothetical protein H2200_006390 [Cladophialophora chaetospira]|uniref:BZIP domain-containing protein n=1 Tax=Cladophialophora chaetospira TaxID=386627 RepID=A0AA38X8Q2_9EURO|nr:hypothetical protein H2200_006390 [Cladophialophora chaetospira]